MYDIELGQGDTESRDVLINNNGESIAGATVYFTMTCDYPATKYKILCTITDAETGLVTIPFTATHTSIPGFFQGEFKLEFPDQVTFPGSGYIKINIKESLYKEV